MTFFKTTAYVVLLLLIFFATPLFASSIQRQDFSVTREPNISLFVRQVHLEKQDKKQPVLLVHGARVPGVASFDLQVPHGSLAEDLAQAGHPVYIMDAFGYGYSSRPVEMQEKPGATKPLVRSASVVRDIAAVVDWIRKHRKVERVALLGWATGGHWCGFYTSLYPDKVSDLVVYNSLYGGNDRHARIGHGSALEDPQRPGQFNSARFGAYRFSTAVSLFGSWDRSIPIEDKAAWRDPQITKAYAKAALASDKSSQDREPSGFRAPSGALEDSFYMATGRQLWDASLITSSRVLIIATELDFWSRPADRETLQRHLVNAPEVRSVLIPQATHYVHLDRPERGRRQFVSEIINFFSNSE